MPELFLDSGFAIALASRRDQHHQRAAALAREIKANASKLVTTQAVVLEIGNSLSKRNYRADGVRLITSLRSDPSVEIAPDDDELFDKSFSLFANREDKEWSLTDCMSFVVMEARGIRDALTPDEHFTQAGFNALMRR
ncbi:MAG: type II toxin-antitoxin system VapC family toxin [Pirellulales bacterium]|nr:type II toxin-antitoxin system VapC family toxin [Pirellulales bacterium]